MSRTNGSRLGSKAEAITLGPNSITWRALSDWRILLCGGRSLLLQVAHPVVAAGVSQHSNFTVDPWKRLIGTLELYFGGVIFGWPAGAAAAAARLRSTHARIRGVDALGRPYRALEPGVFHWVHATLVDSSAVLLEHFGTPLRGSELTRFYDEMREVGRLCGLRDREMPPDWASFREYFDEMVRTALEDTRVVREVLSMLANAPRPCSLPVPDLIWRWCLWPSVGHLVWLCSIGLLPVPLRERLEIPWTRAQEIELRVNAALLRRAVPLLPERLRMHPWAYAAYYGAGRLVSPGCDDSGRSARSSGTTGPI